ncbi:hypothetical protein AQS8620_00414 [Aquimixticola soesokkakensis]|uniref:Uncharacterized protein n=1 Tax=Aquimixticola soesokkakensis TaxID=1519096 RepID=A0A1Y5RJM5_9RHOB|nr:hypothetical protein [Aquimixticola soesokkakensis]SLN18887.1 hypothetical protein AQS8620_00414 [Aquimixticola soesokkakensis]
MRFAPLRFYRRCAQRHLTVPVLHRLRRALLGMGALALVAACTDAAQLTPDSPRADLGDFSFGHNVVVAAGMQQAPFSRTVSEAEVEAALQAAMDARLGGYAGDKLYHIGIKVDAYSLALPGVPMVFTPKSLLVLSVNVWDDKENRKLTEKTKLITVFEGLSGETLVGSGLTRTKAQQLDVLSRNAAEKIEQFLRENGQWFGIAPIAPRGDEAADARAAVAVLAPEAQ